MCHIQARPTRFLIASLALLAAAGCGDSTAPGEPENPGLLLVPTGYHGASLVWTRDGTELLYVVRTTINQKEAALLKAVSISTHTVRQLDVFQPIPRLIRSSAGERIYFGTFISPPSGSVDNFRVNRVHPTSGLLEIVMNTRAGDLAVSADERFLVVGQRLHDLQTAARIDLPTGTPIDFSPDGTQLLYYPYYSATSSPMLISTADGSSQLLRSTGDPYIAHRWEGNSPQLLTTHDDFDKGTVRVSEIDGVTGATHDIAQFSGHVILPPANWSPDGRVLAIWIGQGSHPDPDGPTREYLYTIRSGNAPALLANVAGVPGRPVFSPSGNSIAYFNYYGDLQQAALYLKSGI